MVANLQIETLHGLDTGYCNSWHTKLPPVLYSPVVTLITTRFNKTLYFLPAGYIYGFCTNFRTNSDNFHAQQ